jgi:hypothetical protein
MEIIKIMMGAYKVEEHIDRNPGKMKYSTHSAQFTHASRMKHFKRG